MKPADTCDYQSRIIALLVALLMMAGTLPAHAYYYSGGNWEGRDLTLLDGDTLSGNFSNIGKLYIPAGTSITGTSGNLSLSAGTINIDGSLLGSVQGYYDLSLSAATNFVLNGTLANWKQITLEASTLYVAGTSSISTIGSTTPFSPVTDPSLSAGGKVLDTGGSGIIGPVQGISISDGSIQLPGNNATLSLTTTPIPAAAWLFGSGLLGLAGIRRRRS